MKKLPLLILGVASALLASCACGPGQYSSVASLYVVDEAGRPLQGVILEPTHLTYGCECYDLTGPCGKASVRESRFVNLRRGGFNSVLGVPVDSSSNTYVQMRSQNLGSHDRPVRY